jgi:hypothetical protein
VGREMLLAARRRLVLEMLEREAELTHLDLLDEHEKWERSWCHDFAVFLAWVSLVHQVSQPQ